MTETYIVGVRIQNISFVLARKSGGGPGVPLSEPWIMLAPVLRVGTARGSRDGSALRDASRSERRKASRLSSHFAFVALVRGPVSATRRSGYIWRPPFLYIFKFLSGREVACRIERLLNFFFVFERLAEKSSFERLSFLLISSAVREGTFSLSHGSPFPHDFLSPLSSLFPLLDTSLPFQAVC